MSYATPRARLEPEQLRDFLIATEADFEGPVPTALETSILDVAMYQYPEPIHGYGVKGQLELFSVRDTEMSPGGIYRALGKCADLGWLDALDGYQAAVSGGPARRLFAANTETPMAWVVGLRGLLQPAVDSSFGRGRRRTVN